MSEMEKRIKTLEDLLKIQISQGNWNYNPYMQGTANGMIMCVALMKGEEPKFLDAPDRWLKDTPKPPGWKPEAVEEQPCLHDGLKPGGTHLLSCSCPKCSPRC